MSEPFDSRAEAPPAKRWEKGYGDENEEAWELGTFESQKKQEVDAKALPNPVNRYQEVSL